MEKRLNRMFWICYVGFCLWSLFLLELTGLIDVSSMDRVEHIIMTTALIISGMVMRHWFKKNPDALKSGFKR